MKTKQLSKLLLILPLLAIATGCASVTRGTLDTLEVHSTPDQADVKIYRTNAGLTAKEIKKNTIEDTGNPGGGPIIGITPGTFELARKGEYRVLISKEGYKTTEVEIGNRVSGAGGAGMAGNILAGGIVGIIVDSNTGASKDLTPNPVVVTLEEGEGVVLIPLPKKKAKEEDVADDAEQATEDAVEPEMADTPETVEALTDEAETLAEAEQEIDETESTGEAESKAEPENTTEK